VLGVNPVILLVKALVPVPLDVFVVRAMVGFIFVLQHTPLAVIANPPSLEILPPLTALVAVIDETELVVRTGAPRVVKLTCVP
jgi:hypothetical protein